MLFRWRPVRLVSALLLETFRRSIICSRGETKWTPITNETLADIDCRVGHRPLLPRSVSSSWGRERCALRWARHSVLSLTNRKGPSSRRRCVCALDRRCHPQSSDDEGVPLSMGVSNRLFSLTAIWLPCSSSCVATADTRYSGGVTTSEPASRRARTNSPTASQALVAETWNE